MIALLKGLKTICPSNNEEYDGIVLSDSRCDSPLMIEIGGAEWKVLHDVPSIWRYSNLMPKFSETVTRGEGFTPLRRWSEKDIYLKLEGFNPTGTYMDRGSSVLASFFKTYKPNDSAIIRYSKDFAISAATYLTPSHRTKVVIEDPLKADPEELTSLVYLNAELCTERYREAISYDNPLTIEGLKTIIFEIVERGITEGKILVPSESGVLALSIWKGIKDLEKANFETNFKIIAAVLEDNYPSYLKNIEGIQIEKIKLNELIDNFIELARKGVKVKLVSALGVALAMKLGEGIVIVTGESKGVNLRGSQSFWNDIKKDIAKALEGKKGMTAYEIWRELKEKYTLRGIYKALESLEAEGIVISFFEMRKNKKVRKYSLFPS